MKLVARLRGGHRHGGGNRRPRRRRQWRWQRQRLWRRRRWSDLTATTVGGVTSVPLGSPAHDTAGTPKVVITYTVGSTPCVSNCDANATPELGSGELLATGLLPLGAVLLYRRRRTRRAPQQ